MCLTYDISVAFGFEVRDNGRTNQTSMPCYINLTILIHYSAYSK